MLKESNKARKTALAIRETAYKRASDAYNKANKARDIAHLKALRDANVIYEKAKAAWTNKQ